MIPQPRAHKLVGKHARMAILAATLPTPVLDVLRSRQAPPVPPRSRVPTPPAAQAAGGRTGKAELGEGAVDEGVEEPVEDCSEGRAKGSRLHPGDRR